MLDQDAVSAPATLAVSTTAVRPLHNSSRSNPYDVGYGYVPHDRGRPDGDGLGLRRVATSRAFRDDLASSPMTEAPAMSQGPPPRPCPSPHSRAPPTPAPPGSRSTTDDVDELAAHSPS